MSGRWENPKNGRKTRGVNACPEKTAGMPMVWAGRSAVRSVWALGQSLRPGKESARLNYRPLALIGSTF